MRLFAFGIWLAGFAQAAYTPAEIRGLTEDTSLLRGAITVVVFLSAQCPLSNAYGDRLQRAYDEFQPRGVRFYFVNSNANETSAEIVRNSREHGYTFPIFEDRGSKAADRFGAKATPECYVLDHNAKVVYHGAFDDSPNPARVHRRAVPDSLNQLLAGQHVPIPGLKSLGCSIKRPPVAR